MDRRRTSVIQGMNPSILEWWLFVDLTHRPGCSLEIQVEVYSQTWEKNNLKGTSNDEQFINLILKTTRKGRMEDGLKFTDVNWILSKFTVNHWRSQGTVEK